MSALMSHEIERLKKQILTLGSIVEDRVNMAVKAVDSRDEKLARAVIDGDP